MSAQQKTKTRPATTQTILFLIRLMFLAMIERRSKPRFKKEIFIIVKYIVLIKVGLLLVISDNFLSTIRKYNAISHLHFLLKPKLNSLLSELFSYNVLKTS